VHVDRAAVRGEVALPGLPHQVGAAEHHRRVRGKESEQLELLKRQRYLGPVHPHPALVVVEQQPGPLADGLGAGRGQCGRRHRTRHGDRVTDDGHRRARAWNRDHGEQGAVAVLPRHGLDWPERSERPGVGISH